MHGGGVHGRVRDSLAFDAPSFMPPAGLDLLAAALSFNNLSPDEGFEEFAGEDGRVGLEDFVRIVADLQLGAQAVPGPRPRWRAAT